MEQTLKLCRWYPKLFKVLLKRLVVNVIHLGNSWWLTLKNMIPNATESKISRISVCRKIRNEEGTKAGKLCMQWLRSKQQVFWKYESNQALMK